MIKYINYGFLNLLIGSLTLLRIQSFAQDPDSWIKIDSISGVQRYGAVAFSIGDKAYMGTGYFNGSGFLKDFWEYDPVSDKWTKMADFGGNARAYATGFSIGSKGYVGCGNDGNSTKFYGSKDFWEFDPSFIDHNTLIRTGKWTQRADFGGVPRRGAVGFNIGSKGYIGTGRIDEDAAHPSNPYKFEDFWEYDPVLDTWEQKANFGGSVRAFAVGFSIGTKGYVGTGHDYSTILTNDFWEYDPTYNTWIKKADFGGPIRYGAVGFSIGPYGYIGTGDLGGTYANDFWEYNPVLNIWMQKSDYKGSGRTSATGFSIGNKGYIGTGICFEYNDIKDFWKFTSSAIWSGGIDTVWANSANWESGAVPEFGTDVIIPSTTRDPSITSLAECNNLTINLGAKLTIGAGYSLAVNGTLVNYAGNSGLVIKSDASGTGSMINSTTGVNATIERYVTGDWSSAVSGWHFISSPISSQSISDFTTSGTANGYDFYGWDEASNYWMSYKDLGFNSWNSGTNFNIGQGYMVSYERTQTKVFSGNINVNDIVFSGLSKSNGANYSWHLVGNPFSSAIKWNDGNWTLSHIAGIAKIWDGGGKEYKDINANDIIPSYQGFMISVNNIAPEANSIKIPSSARIQGNTGWYKTIENNQIKLVASEQDGSSYQESNIQVNPLASNGFDFDYDSRFLQGYAPQFYSVSNNERLSTNSLPSISGGDIITFCFIKNQAENFKIELKNTIEGKPVFLYDLKNDSLQNLLKNPVYKFTSDESDDPERFILNFINFSSASQETFSVYQSNGNICITNLEGIYADITVYNILGQMVISDKTNKYILTTINTSDIPNGVYIISIKGNSHVVSKKIIIRN